MSTEVQTLPAEEMNIETVINDKLQKANITEAIIAGLKEKYLPLKINGIDDREGYNEVKEARKECKSWRVMAQKICKDGREDAVAIQKAWVAKEKEVTGKIAEVEDYLQKQEDEYDAEKKRIKEEEKVRHDRQGALRTAELTKFGAAFDGTSFTLEDVSYEYSVIREADDETWKDLIRCKFEAIYVIKQAAIEVEQEAKRLADAKIKEEREEFDRQQAKFREDQEEMKKQQEAIAQRERERLAEQERLKREADTERWRSRLWELAPIGANGQEAFAKYDESVIVATLDQLISWSDEEFAPVKKSHLEAVAKDAEEKEKQRLAAIAQQEKEIKGKNRRSALLLFKVDTYSASNLSEMPDDEWEKIYAACAEAFDENKRREWDAQQRKIKEDEEAKRQADLDKAKDKEKWEDVLSYLSKTPVHEMRSSQYRTKMKSVKDFLAGIKTN